MEEVRKMNRSVRHLRLVMGLEQETREIGSLQLLNSMNHISLIVTHQFASDPGIYFVEN